MTARSLLGLRDVLRKDRPDLVLVQGDTTTCFTAALAAFYEHIPVGHIEAGLRTGNLQAPFPEEANRSLVGRIAPSISLRQKARGRICWPKVFRRSGSGYREHRDRRVVDGPGQGRKISAGTLARAFGADTV